jgi:hypothetical protein
VHASDRQGAEQRAQGRAAWPVRTYRLGEEPTDDLSAVTTPEERLAMMWALALEAWSVAGLALPTYTRAETPVRCIRRAGPDGGRT